MLVIRKKNTNHSLAVRESSDFRNDRIKKRVPRVELFFLIQKGVISINFRFRTKARPIRQHSGCSHFHPHFYRYQ